MKVNNNENSRIVVDSFNKRGEIAKPEDVKPLGLEFDDADRVYICDRNGRYAMFHYRDDYDKTPVQNNIQPPSSEDGKKCSWGDRMSVMKEAEEAMKRRVSAVRGWIINTETGKLCCRSFTESPIVFVSPSELKQYSDDEYTFKPFVEGATLRLFWNEEKETWFHSTHRKIDCSRSRIPGVELGFLEMFNQACPDFDYSQLDKSKIYIIQIMHRDNQIMNQEIVETPTAYHIASIINCGEDDMMLIDGCEDNRLNGLSYLENIELDEAIGLLQIRKCVIVRKDYEIIQIAPKTIQKLMKIRGYDETPYIPVELMYLRLSPEERPLLIQAVPPHQKKWASKVRMEKYIENGIHQLSNFCAGVLLDKIRGRKIFLSKTLNWLVNKAQFETKPRNHAFVKTSYELIIRELSEKNGINLYRCFKDLESFKKNQKKKGLKQLSKSQDSCFNSYSSEGVSYASIVKKSSSHNDISDLENKPQFRPKPGKHNKNSNRRSPNKKNPNNSYRKRRPKDKKYNGRKSPGKPKSNEVTAFLAKLGD